jgi:two-component system response regulator HydG
MYSAERETHQRKTTKTDRGFEADITPLAEMERQAIMQALLQLGGDKSEAARRLGIGKSTLYRKLKRYGLTH